MEDIVLHASASVTVEKKLLQKLILLNARNDRAVVMLGNEGLTQIERT